MSLDTKRIVNHIITSWRHHLTLQFATLVVLVACFSVITGVLVFSHNLQRILTLWGESMQVSVYFNENASDENISSVQNFLQKQSELRPAKFVSKEAALGVFREQMSSYAPDLMQDKDLMKFIPSSFQFGVLSSVDAGEQLGLIKTIANKLKSMAGVEDVSYGQDWIKSYATLTNILTYGGFLFIVVIFAASLFVLSNSIHNSISQRRAEIEVMELIGATSNYIRSPFICEGALLGFFSSSFAVVLSFIFYSVAKNYLHEQIAFLQLSSQVQFIDTGLILALLLFGVLAGALSSWICVKKINTGWAAVENLKI